MALIDKMAIDYDDGIPVLTDTVGVAMRQPRKDYNEAFQKGVSASTQHPIINLGSNVRRSSITRHDGIF